MTVSRIAIMEICSQELVLKVYEVAKKKEMTCIETARKMIPVGKDTFGEGRISSQVLDQICAVLQKFEKIIEGYRITDYYCLATSAVREALNCTMVVEQIRVRTGISVIVLSNAEQRYLRLKGVISRENNFKLLDKGTALVDVGSASLQISIYEKKVLVTTQNIMLGLARITEMCSELAWKFPVVEQVLRELIANDIQTFEKMYLKDHAIKNLIMMGDNVIASIRRELNFVGKPGVNVDDIRLFYEELKGKSDNEIARRLQIPLEYASLVFPMVILAQTLLETTGAELIWFPESDLCDGYALDIFEKQKVRKKEYDFEEDILASSRTMCKRYKGNQEHALHLEKLSVRLFDTIRRYHGLGSREKLLLRICAILHDCGKFISLSTPGDCAYYLIMSTEILGLSQEEQEMVANVVRYNTKDLPAYDEFEGKLSSRSYMTVMKLAAILRIANALDRSHKQKFAGMKAVVKGDTLEITTDYPGDITLEKHQIEMKAGFFEEVYGLKLSVRKKLKNKGV